MCSIDFFFKKKRKEKKERILSSIVNSLMRSSLVETSKINESLES